MSRVPSDAYSLDDRQFFRVAEALSEESRREIVADIVAHPKGLPCMKELEFSTGLHRATLYQHLDILIEADIVEEVEIPVGQKNKGQPGKFYGITDGARELFDANSIYPEDLLKDLYSQVNKPNDVKAAEAAPRPHGTK